MAVSSLSRITYIANAGVMVEYKDSKLVIDGVHVRGVAPYFSVDGEVLSSMCAGIEPYDDIDLLLFTHDHIDHFDAEMTNKILLENPRTFLLGTYTTIRRLRHAKNYDVKLEVQISQFEIPLYRSMHVAFKGVPIDIISMHHDGEVYRDEENYAYYFQLKDQIYLHVGDAAPVMDNFERAGIFERRVDVLFVPFPFIGLSEGRRIIDIIAPKQIVVLHLPQKELDEQNWIFNTYRSYKKFERSLPPCEFFVRPGQSIVSK